MLNPWTRWKFRKKVQKKQHNKNNSAGRASLRSFDSALKLRATFLLGAPPPSPPPVVQHNRDSAPLLRAPPRAPPLRLSPHAPATVSLLSQHHPVDPARPAPPLGRTRTRPGPSPSASALALTRQPRPLTPSRRAPGLLSESQFPHGQSEDNSHLSL